MLRRLKCLMTDTIIGKKSMYCIFLQYSFDNKTENFDDVPARFGYRLPSDGLKVSVDELCCL